MLMYIAYEPLNFVSLLISLVCNNNAVCDYIRSRGNISRSVLNMVSMSCSRTSCICRRGCIWTLYTTTGHGCSNINLCYYRLINLLLGLLVTHLVSVPILDVTMVSPTGTQHMCSFISKKVLQWFHCVTYFFNSSNTSILCQ